jgi:cell division protein FtsI/penicillin-binding protein 2
MTPEQNAIILKGMWGVVNGGGTAGSLKTEGFEIAGKTGTAQNSALGSGGAKDHAWFVSFAPSSKPEISVIGLIENSGFGGTHAGPAVKNVYNAFLQKNYPHILGGGEQLVAKR